MLSKKLFLSSTVLFVLISLPLIGSVGASSEMWSQTYGGAGQEVAYAVVETSDGGYAIAGYTNSSGAGGYDFWLVKTDNYGNMEWNRTYGGASSDRAHSLVETSDGGYALAGYTSSFGAGSFDFWLIKTDEYGNMEWNRTYGGAGEDIARSLIVTSDGGYAIAGIDLLVKTDAYGNMEWNQTYGGYSLVETSDGGYALAGATNIRINYSDADFWLIKTDAYGNMLWNKTYSKGVDYAMSLVETADGGFALAGSTGFWFSTDVWLVKTDENGLMKWNKEYGSLSGYASSLVMTSDGGFALAGKTDHIGAGGYDFWLIKTDADGSMMWNQTYGGAEDEIAYSLVVTSDGGFAIAGETSSFGAGDSDFWLVKTDEYGIIPEFPSWTPVLVMVVALVAMIVVYRYNLKKPRGWAAA